MELREHLPKSICIKDRPTWEKYLEKNNFDLAQEFVVYRDIKSGDYVFIQDRQDIVGVTDDR